MRRARKAGQPILGATEIKLNGKAMASCNGCGSKWGGEQAERVGSFAQNRFGLLDMVGNVEEWTEDCWNENYEGTPPLDGSAWTTSGDCTARVTRGGSY